ncbi:unnamed protein product [Orchesella dallaii]|uniref:Uncharacterized protein n=1 Tax=Orchesella dallaii TaxID=48710 RepID=A0ABP1S743_9HEXA
MEQYLQKFLKFYQSIGSFPYKLTFIPESQEFSIHFDSKSFWIWATFLATGLFHWGKTVITLAYFAPEYLKRKEYVNIVCHVMWTIGFCGMLCPHLPLAGRMNEVMQLGNGTLRSMSYIEKGANLIYVPYISSATGFGFVQGIFMTVRMAYMANVIITGLGILCILICGSILLVVTTIAGTINEQSLMFVRHVKGKGYRGSLGRRIVRAFKIVSVKSGNLYEVKRLTSLTVLGMLANVSGSVLLSIHF